MSSVVAFFVAAAVAGAGAAPPAASEQASPSAPTPSATSTSTSTSTSTQAPAAAPGAVRGAWGVGLLAAGAGLATGSVVGLTLLESVTTPDRDNQPVTPSQETLRSVGGFASAAVAGVSLVAMVVGGGLAISAGLDARGTPSSAPVE